MDSGDMKALSDLREFNVSSCDHVFCVVPDWSATIGDCFCVIDLLQYENGKFEESRYGHGRTITEAVQQALGAVKK